MANKKTKLEQITDAARKLFTDYGYRRVSMDEIAREAGVVKMTIYQYFKDKDDLLKYFISDEILRMKEVVEDIESRSKSAYDMIHNTAYELLKYRRNQKLLITMTKEAESFRNNSLCEALKEIDNSIISYIEAKINKGIDTGAIKSCNAHLIAFALFKVYIAVAFEYEEEGNKLNENAIHDTLNIFLKTGLLN